MSLFFGGLDQLDASDVAYNLRGPCGDCPFRRDAPDHEGVASSVIQYLEMIEAGRFAHTCHKTDNRPGCDGPRNFKGEKTEHCAGALHFLIRSGNDLQRSIVRAIEDGRLDIHEATKLAQADESVFATRREFLDYYAAMIERIIERKRNDPLVCVWFEEHAGDPPTMVRLSRARSEGLNIVPCCKCGEPATDYDPKWPIFQELNFCDQHRDDGLADVASDLRKERADCDLTEQLKDAAQ